MFSQALVFGGENPKGWKRELSGQRIGSEGEKLIILGQEKLFTVTGMCNRQNAFKICKSMFISENSTGNKSVIER